MNRLLIVDSYLDNIKTIKSGIKGSSLDVKYISTVSSTKEN